MSAGKNNIQDQILNAIRKQKMEVTLYLTNGVPLRGRIISFDNFTVILENEGKQSLVYKHAMSTVVFSKALEIEELEKKAENRESRENRENRENKENKIEEKVTIE